MSLTTDTKPTPAPTYVDADEIQRTIDIIDGDADRIERVRVTMTHDDTRREISRAVGYDPTADDAMDVETGYVNGVPVYRRRFDDSLDWRGDGRVYVTPLRDEMNVLEYADIATADRPDWRLGGGFEEAWRDHGVAIDGDGPTPP